MREYPVDGPTPHAGACGPYLDRHQRACWVGKIVAQKRFAAHELERVGELGLEQLEHVVVRLDAVKVAKGHEQGASERVVLCSGGHARARRGPIGRTLVSDARGRDGPPPIAHQRAQLQQQRTLFGSAIIIKDWRGQICR